MLKKRRSLIAVSIVVLAVLLAFAFHLFMAQMIRKYLASHIAVASVAAQEVTYANWASETQSAGSFVAVQNISLTPQVSGVVTSLSFDSGQVVKQGDVILTMESEAENAALAASKATLARAQLTYKRTKLLAAQGAATEDSLEEAATRLKTAIADMLTKKDALSKKTITAPFAGQLGLRLVSLGQYLVPGTSVISSLTTLDPIFIDFSVTEDVAHLLKTGQPVSVETDAFLNKSFTGSVLGRNPNADPQTHTVLFRAQIDNPTKELFPGLFGRVHIKTSKEKNRLAVPKSAIAYNPYGASVYILNRDPSAADSHKVSKGAKHDELFVADQIFVTLGEEHGNLVAIDDGVKEGDMVVIAGQLKIKKGSKARIVQDSDILATPDPVIER